MNFMDRAIEDPANQLRRAAKIGLFVGVGLSLVSAVITAWGLIRIAVETRQTSFVFLGIVMFILILGCGSFYSWRSMLRHAAIASNAKNVSDGIGAASYPRRSKKNKRRDDYYANPQFIPGYGYGQAPGYGGYDGAGNPNYAYNQNAAGAYRQPADQAYVQQGYVQQGYVQQGYAQQGYAQQGYAPAQDYGAAQTAAGGQAQTQAQTYDANAYNG